MAARSAAVSLLVPFSSGGAISAVPFLAARSAAVSWLVPFSGTGANSVVPLFGRLADAPPERADGFGRCPHPKWQTGSAEWQTEWQTPRLKGQTEWQTSPLKMADTSPGRSERLCRFGNRLCRGGCAGCASDDPARQYKRPRPSRRRSVLLLNPRLLLDGNSQSQRQRLMFRPPSPAPRINLDPVFGADPQLGGPQPDADPVRELRTLRTSSSPYASRKKRQ